MATKELRAELRKPFPAQDVKQRQGPGKKMLDYVAGETVLNRLLDATTELDSGYVWQITHQHVERTEDGKWAVVVSGMLLIQGDAGGGTGAMVNNDLDMAAKSANTEAIKNAAKNGFGVGLELWDAEYRATLGQKRRLADGNEQALKSEVWDLAKQQLGNKKPTPQQIADLFGVKPGDLADSVILKDILKAEGYEL